MPSDLIRGSCLCRAVRYEIRGPLAPMAHCHCSQCRKAHGAAFGSYSWVDHAAFRFVEGGGLVRTYASSPGVARTFCPDCGSTLQYVAESHAGGFWVAVGTLDDDPLVRPSLHMFVGSKAPWYEIADDLPRHREWPLADSQHSTGSSTSHIGTAPAD